MKIIAFSDTHGLHDKIEIPECDVLVFAGDWSSYTSIESTIDFSDWLVKQPAKYKIVIPGNHDQYSYILDDSITLLENSAIGFDGIRFFGSPYTRDFMGWFYMKSEEELEDMYKDLPKYGIDVLITHGPPLGVLDTCNSEHLGCSALLDYVNILKPKIHIFGHIHNIGMDFNGDTESFNVAILDHGYIQQQKPIVFTL